jgi:hypothetical protein
MGFDINVMMELFLCPATGKPFYYGRDKETKKVEKVYELPTLIVPEMMRKYLVGRGHIFHAYTDHFNEKEIFNVSVDEFLEEYPTWDDVMKCDYYSDEGYWSEEDHEGFKRLLEWSCQQGVSFRVAWSY